MLPRRRLGFICKPHWTRLDSTALPYAVNWWPVEASLGYFDDVAPVGGAGAEMLEAS